MFPTLELIASNVYRTTVASPVEDGRTRGVVGNAIHHCMDSFKRCKNTLTGARMAQLKDIDAEDDIVILYVVYTSQSDYKH